MNHFLFSQSLIFMVAISHQFCLSRSTSSLDTFFFRILRYVDYKLKPSSKQNHPSSHSPLDLRVAENTMPDTKIKINKNTKRNVRSFKKNKLLCVACDVYGVHTAAHMWRCDTNCEVDCVLLTLPWFLKSHSSPGWPWKIAVLTHKESHSPCMV